MPRLGTISPWSSKATDILRGCNFPIRRVEHGVAYVIEKLPEAESARVAEARRDVARSDDAVGAHARSPMPVRCSPPGAPSPLVRIELGNDAAIALSDANRRLGLALAADEIEYLSARYGELKRDPTDAELMMFAQANSEHCRHKVFNANWTIDGAPQEKSLFAMIKNTHAVSPQHTLSAYHDNAAVIEGNTRQPFLRRCRRKIFGRARSDSVRDQGRDAQSSDGDFAVSRRIDRRRR